MNWEKELINHRRQFFSDMKKCGDYLKWKDLEMAIDWYDNAAKEFIEIDAWYMKDNKTAREHRNVIKLRMIRDYYRKLIFEAKDLELKAEKERSGVFQGAVT